MKMPNKDEYVKFKNFEKKVKSTFMIYTDFESKPFKSCLGKDAILFAV